MKVLLSGATGLVGTELCRELLRRGDEVIVLGRGSEERFRQKCSLPLAYRQWKNPDQSLPPFSDDDGIDVVIHLSGESIAEGRWTKNKKQRIRSSRVDVTRQMSKAIAQMNRKPKAVLGASAIGFYGDTGDQSFSEKDSSGDDFLSAVCRDWELAWGDLGESCRLALLRIGVVLSERGGFLKTMEPVFTLGVGGRISSGRQWVSWIDIEDLVRSLFFIIENEKIAGPVNLVSPGPVQNMELTSELSQAFHKPAPFPVPKFAMQMLIGEMSALALTSQKVSPSVLLENGFEFNYSTLRSSLEKRYEWKTSPHDQLMVDETFVDRELSEVFAFFSQAKNLQTITPESLNFRIDTMSTEQIEQGTIIDYKLKVHGVPLRWRSEIEVWEPGQKFRDIQLKGPYQVWKHDHVFEKLAGGTLMTDRVVYRLPLGILSRGPALGFVEKDVGSIFKFRKSQIGKIFPVTAT